jgi:3',5'-cyclic AMP phosphodiesterase CpdA
MKRLPWQCPGFILALLLLPAILVAGEPLRVVVVSDLNGSYGSSRYEAPVDMAMARILELKPDLVISTGDMVAGQRRPHLSRKEIEPMWQAFHTHVSQPLAGAGIPFSVTPGNHDGSAYNGFALERAIYAEQWMPRKPEVRFVDDAGYPYHYAFELGDVLFISLDATVVGHLPPSQMDWLRAVLDNNAEDYRRRVVFSHVPLWPFAQGRERDFIGDHELQALLEAADVDLYLSGHHHAFYPGAMRGVAFVSQSCLGAGPRRLLGMNDRSPRSFTLIEITADDLNIAAIAAPRFESVIDWNTLPARIRSSAAELERADLSDTGVGKLVQE